MDDKENSVLSNCEKCISLQKKLDEKDKSLTVLHEEFELLKRKMKDQMERNKELEFLPAIYHLYHEEYNVENALEIYVRSVCQFSGWDIGHIYIVSDKKDTVELQPSSIWYLKNNEKI